MHGSATVFINNKAAVRMGDTTQHCGGVGRMIEGSPNVMIGDSTSSGPGPSAAAQHRSANATAGGATAGAAGSTPQGANGGSNSGSSARGANSGPPANGATPEVEGADADAGANKQPADEHVYVINTQLAAPGGVPLGGEQVVLVKAGTDERVAGPFTTDAQGGFATVVPENVPYDVQMLDTEHPGAARANDDRPVQAHLHVAFFENGMPVGGEAVTITRPDGSSFAAVTNADGVLDLVADHGEHQLSIRGDTFHAHTLTSADLDDGGSHYEFAMSPPDHDFETARANRYHPDSDDEGDD